MNRNDAIEKLAEALKARAEQAAARAQNIVGDKATVALKDIDWTQEAIKVFEESIAAVAYAHAMNELGGFAAPPQQPVPLPR